LTSRKTRVGVVDAFQASTEVNVVNSAQKSKEMITTRAEVAVGERVDICPQCKGPMGISKDVWDLPGKCEWWRMEGSL
jgi:hypothetical protein